MQYAVDDAALDILFRTARTQNEWTDRSVTDDELQAIYDLMKLGPTSANASPARLLFCRSQESKERLASCASSKNAAKIRVAPVTVIVAYDTKFYEKMPKLFPLPHVEQMMAVFKDPAFAQPTAFRNSSLQGGYLIFAARALGLDCGPMSGFQNDKVDAAFFAGTQWKSNFICSLGHGNPAGVVPRLPRLSFDEACRIV